MSIALLGIILVQSFWIKTTLDNKEEQFSLNINQALKSVSEQIQSRELRDYLVCKNNDLSHSNCAQTLFQAFPSSANIFV